MKQAGIINCTCEYTVHVYTLPLHVYTLPSGLYRRCSGSGCVPGQELTQQHRTSPGLQWTEKEDIHVYITYMYIYPPPVTMCWSMQLWASFYRETATDCCNISVHLENRLDIMFKLTNHSM